MQHGSSKGGPSNLVPERDVYGNLFDQGVTITPDPDKTWSGALGHKARRYLDNAIVKGKTIRKGASDAFGHLTSNTGTGKIRTGAGNLFSMASGTIGKRIRSLQRSKGVKRLKDKITGPNHPAIQHKPEEDVWDSTDPDWAGGGGGRKRKGNRRHKTGPKRHTKRARTNKLKPKKARTKRYRTKKAKRARTKKAKRSRTKRR